MMVPATSARPAAFAIVALLMAVFAVPARAQLLNLSISPTTITFPNSDPDTVPIVSSAVVQVTYRIRQNNNNNPWVLSVLANGHLVAGSATVDISNVSWVATPSPPFQSGVLSRTVAQRVAGGIGNQANASQGQITFRLANSWNYVAGLYTQTIIFTLAAP